MGDMSVLLSLGGGLEIRLSLLFKIFFLFSNVIYLLKNKLELGLFKPVLGFCFFLLLSTFTVFFYNPAYLISSMSVNVHVLLMFNIILYIDLYGRSEEQLTTFIRGIRFFGLVNAILVIISYLMPNSLSIFEAGNVEGGIRRAFGIMGDEVSILIVFFLFDCLVFRNFSKAIIFAVALLCTGSIGATITAVFLISFYYFSKLRLNKKSILIGITILGGFISIIGFVGIGNINVGVVKRINSNISNSSEGTGNLRLASALTALEMIREKPLLGYGYGNYKNVIRDRYKPIFDKIGLTYRFESSMVILGSSFNPFLQILAESGFLGLVAFILLLIYFVKIAINYYQSLKDRKADLRYGVLIFYWILFFFLTAVSANWMLPTSYLFLLLVSLLVMLTDHENSNQRIPC